MTRSTIEWTQETWNPTVGCSRVSPGCDHCYAIGVAHRAMQPAHEGLTIRRPGERVELDWNGTVRCLPERLEVPLRRRKPTTFFVDSMSDLFHPEVPSDFICQVWEVMGQAQQHTFQILTKRPQRMAALLSLNTPQPSPNVWLGTSIESDRYAFRADHLRATPAAVRFLSLEPLLGPLPSLDLAGINWVIVGGESGPGARPMHPDWVRDIRDRCVAAGVPFFFKQWGAWLGFGRDQFAASYESAASHRALHYEWNAGEHGDGVFTGASVQIGKKAAGRMLDGRTWDEMPAR